MFNFGLNFNKNQTLNKFVLTLESTSLVKKSTNKTLNDLPKDVIAIILSFASSYEWGKWSLVNKWIFDASKHELVESEKSRRAPLSKLIMTLFQQRTKDGIHGIMIGDLSKVGNITPKETYGKISKTEKGTIIVSLSQEVTKQEANFSIKEDLCVEDKPSSQRRKESLTEKVLNLFIPKSTAYDTHCTLFGFKVTLLDSNMSKELKNLIVDGELFLNHLFETHHKTKKSRSKNSMRKLAYPDITSPFF